MGIVNIDFSQGVIGIADFDSTIGVFIKAGQRVKLIDSGNTYAILRDASPNELFKDIMEKTLTETGGAISSPASVDAQIDAKDEWETSGGKLQPKSGTAPNGVSIGTEATSFSTASGGVFSNIGAFVEFDSDHYQLIAMGTNLESGQTSSYSGGWTVTGNGSLTDGSELTNVYLSTGASSETVTIDLTTATKFNRVRLMPAGS